MLAEGEVFFKRLGDVKGPAEAVADFPKETGFCRVLREKIFEPSLLRGSGFRALAKKVESMFPPHGDKSSRVKASSPWNRCLPYFPWSRSANQPGNGVGEGIN